MPLLCGRALAAVQGKLMHATPTPHCPCFSAISTRKQAGALVLLDSCQFLPHRRADVQALGCDFLVASGHKALAPTSSGLLWGRWAGRG